MDKIQKNVLEYFKKVNEVTRGQIITVISNKNNYERDVVQKAINLLLDAKLLQIIGRADTLALTNAGQKMLQSWYKRINWIHYILKILTYLGVFILGLFANEIKNLIISLFN